MEILVPTISFLILGLLLISPWIILKFLKEKQEVLRFLLFILWSIPSFFILMLIFAWWGDYSTGILLEYYGYELNLDTVSENNFENVLPENIEKVKSLRISYMGIGWPLKAIIGAIYYSPYLLFVFLIRNILVWVKNKFNSQQSPNSGN